MRHYGPTGALILGDNGFLYIVPDFDDMETNTKSDFKFAKSLFSSYSSALLDSKRRLLIIADCIGQKITVLRKKAIHAFKVAFELRPKQEPMCISWARRNSFLVVEALGAIEFFRVGENSVKKIRAKSFFPGESITELIVLEKKDLAVCCGENGRVFSFYLSSFRLFWSKILHEDHFFLVKEDPISRNLVLGSGCQDKKLYELELSTGNKAAKNTFGEIEGLTGGIIQIEFSSCGKFSCILTENEVVFSELASLGRKEGTNNLRELEENKEAKHKVIKRIEKGILEGGAIRLHGMIVFWEIKSLVIGDSRGYLHRINF